MNIASLATVAMLVGCATASAQIPSESSMQYIPAEGFCSSPGVVWDADRKLNVCSGKWTLTFSPPTRAAAHLVGGMAPIEVKAVLNATGVAYQPAGKDALIVGTAKLWFGEQGLEGWGPYLPSTP